MSKIGIDDFIEDTQATADDVNSLPRVELRPRLAPEALYGLPGRIVSTFEPYTEADEAGTLGHLLAGIGNLIGPEAHARVLDDKHPARLSLVVVGRTAKARKGIAWSPVRAILTRVDPGWARERITTGLSSGEGLIAKVRDDGEQDRRLLVVESEFAVPLKRMQREANTLSAILRDAWDHGNLATLVKNNPLRATGAHVSVIGHITEEELRRYLTETERANGFANRFIFLYVDRSKLLPDGASVPEEVLAPLIQELRDAVTFSRQPREVRRDDEAREVWREVYPALSEGEPGLVGALTSRAEAQVLRMSLLYALLDKSTTIRVPHLRAALAVWDYAVESTRRIFGRRLGNAIAETILEALRTRGAMTQTDIFGLFKRNRSAEEIQSALDALRETGRVSARVQQAGGRPATIWEARS
jgi:hypothetical protein